MSGALATPKAKPRPFKLTAPVLPEDDMQAALVRNLDILLLPPAEYTAFPAGNILLDGQQASKLNRMGLRRGWPDILIVHQGIWGLELKIPGGRLSRTRTVRDRRGRLRTLVGQEEMHPRLLAAGFRGIAVADSLEGALAQLRAWGIPMRRTA